MRDNMSTALVSANVSAFYDVSDVLCNNFKNPPSTTRTHLKFDKRAVGTPIHGIRRHSTSSTSSITNGNGVNANTNVNDAGKLRDRAMSESDRNQQQQRTQTSRYKTELCRPFEENGTCKYGDKCQFAHGMHELRNLSRHPKYKSELCRTFHTVGFCPYGPRCHFIHNPEERKLSVAYSEQQQAQQLNKPPRDHTVERPKLLHFPSAPLGSTGSGDLTPPSDSPTSMTPPPSLFGDEITSNMPLSASVLQTAVSVFNFTQRQRNQQELPNLMSPIMSPTISGISSPFGSGPMSPFTNLQQLSEIEQQSQSPFQPPMTRQDSSVFFSDNLNDFSRNTFRPPSPPDSLSDPESLGESMGPASPTFITPSASINPILKAPPSSSPMVNQHGGRLPIFRGMSHEERF